MKPTKYDAPTWIFQNDDDSLHALRKYLGLPPITFQEKPCKRCGETMTCQFNGTRRIDHYCNYCRHYLNNQSDIY